MKKLYQIYEPVYCSSIFLYIGSYKEFSLYAKNKFNYEPSKGYAALCKQNGNDVIIWVDNKSKLSLLPHYIMHESIHAAIFVLDYAGVKVGYKNQEPLCYLATYYADSLIDMVNKEIEKERKKNAIRK